jgi:flagellin
MLLSALTINTATLAASEFSNAGNPNIRSFAAKEGTDAINLSDISVGVFTQAIENIATLRADNGASMSRLRFAGEEMAIQETNLSAAKGRITDVDIAAESTRMAKYNVLVQASASMLAQANSSADIALMLLR